MQQCARFFVSLSLLSLLIACQGYPKRPGLLDTVGLWHSEQPEAHPSAARPPAELSLMTFNIRYGTANDGENSWDHRKDLLFDVVRGARPDIVGVQEALRSQLDQIKAALPEYSEVGVGRDDGKAAGEYSAILYRTELFELWDSGTFWFSKTPDVPGSVSWGNTLPRICTWADLCFKEDSSAVIRVFNVHLDHQSERSRRASAGLLADRVWSAMDRNKLPIVMGDFNCGERSNAILFMQGKTPLLTRPEEHSQLQGWSGMVDTYRWIHPDASDVGTFHAFKGDTKGEKIDYIFVPPGIEIVNSQIIQTSRDGRYPSDHFPVTAVLRLSK